MVVDTPLRSDERLTQQQLIAWLSRWPASDRNHDELIGGRIAPQLELTIEDLLAA